MRIRLAHLRTPVIFACIALVLYSEASVSLASSYRTAKATPKPTQEPLFGLYRASDKEYDVSWALLAAIDRYAELTKSKSVRKEVPYYGFGFEPSAWEGIANPLPDDYNPSTIRLFNGIGVDEDGDGLALPWDPADRIGAMARWIDGASQEEDAETAVWNLFQDPVAVERIFAFAHLFNTYGTNMSAHCFPVAKRYNYSVKHSFGAGRSYGGARRHEGVDIFASYGTPVLASCYGYVELKGWNRFGGWRLGIRDANNIYYYYAHLSSYVKGLKQGDLVRPGQVIGYVGSSGYGPPGTSGKFPPHLHFGLYRDFGRHEWAFSPSPSLVSWERMPQKVIYPPKS